jgi:hypothetical protein
MRTKYSAFLTLWAGACLAGAALPVVAQESDARLPEAAKLALRGRPGDVIRKQADVKSTTHLHLEALLSELTQESTHRDDVSFRYRGKGPNGALQLEVRGTTRLTNSDTNGQPHRQTITPRPVVFTVKPTLEIAKITPLSGGTMRKRAATAAANSTAGSEQLTFGLVRFPDRVLKAGDTWSGTATLPALAELGYIPVSYNATLVAFEMYQSFPCARVEVSFSYNGALPKVEARIRKTAPKITKMTSMGHVTGLETVYYSLDRGWFLNDEIKVSSTIDFVVTVSGRTVEFGGTTDIESHAAVTAYPPYDPSLVPKVAAAPPSN